MRTRTWGMTAGLGLAVGLWTSCGAVSSPGTGGADVGVAVEGTPPPGGGRLPGGPVAGAPADGAPGSDGRPPGGDGPGPAGDGNGGSAAGAGMAARAGGIFTVGRAERGARLPSGALLTLSQDGFELAGAACSGGVCVTGGIFR